MTNATDKVPALLHAIELVDSAIALAEGALNDNPSPEEERALNQTLLRLNAERAVLEAELDAALNEDTAVQGPNAAQLAQIESLSKQVEQATSAGAAADAKIALAGKVLNVAAAIVGPWPPK